MTQKKIVFITALVHVSPSHATEKIQLAIKTNNQQNIDNNKRKNSEREVYNDMFDAHTNASHHNRVETPHKKRTNKATRKQNNSENDIVHELFKNLGQLNCNQSMLQSRIKQSMSNKMIQQANENIDTFLPLLTNICIEEESNLSTSNEADWIDQQERIKNLFRQTIILKAEPTTELVKKHFANANKMKRRLIQWFGIAKDHHDALETLMQVVKDKYDNDLDVILNITNPERQNTWYTAQAQDFWSTLSDEIGPEGAKTLLKSCPLAEIQNIVKEKLKQCTNDAQKEE